MTDFALNQNVSGTDGGPMVMEAHQHLSGPIDPASCDNVQVVVAGPATQALLQFQNNKQQLTLTLVLPSRA